jgi:hypothetical protein
MKIRNITVMMIVVAVLSLAADASGAGTMGTSRGHDLDALWAQAQKAFDTSEHDAILLLESRHETILEGGGRRTIVHRAVWIGTPPGLRDHADLRIPWNSAVSTFRVHLLRTWRDGRWWPHESKVSSTAVVETLPFAVASADDYTTVREAMLLHDGVELPCIMETAYEIEQQPGPPGYDGIFVMQQRDPAALVELKIDIPDGVSLELNGYNGAPVPGTAGGDREAAHIITMENLERLGSPRISDPSVYAPTVVWSTWPGWSALKEAFMPVFEEASVTGTDLSEIISERLMHEPSDAARARSIASLVNELTRSIHYDPGFWQFSPRPAARTYETAYGHPLDRAVLAAAMFRAAGLEAEPVFVSSGPAAADIELPGFCLFGEMRICVHSGDFRAIYDPAEGALSEGPRAIFGRTAWKPASDDAPWSYPPAGSGPSSYAVTMTIEPGEEGWNGAGYIDADGIFCPYADMAGLGGEGKAATGEIAGSVLGGAEVTSFSPETFGKTRVSAGFGFSLGKAAADDHGRQSITIGSPRGGITEIMPADVHLYHESRTSPVVIPGAMAQSVTVRIKTCKKGILHLPEARKLENGAGSFAISVEMDEGWVTIVRELEINGGMIEPEAWPQLRALLLEAQDGAGRTILLE